MGNDNETLSLGIYAPNLQLIIRGYKTCETRKRTDYYKGLLVEEESLEPPAKGAQGWTRCADGLWRRFKPWETLELHCEELGSWLCDIEGYDCGAGGYSIRLSSPRKNPEKG